MCSSKQLVLLSDKVLINKLQCGEGNAFNMLYAGYWQKLFVFVCGIVHDRAAAQDIVQDVFVSLWLRRQEVNVNGSLHNYLHTAVRYRALSYLSANMRQSQQLQQLVTGCRLHNLIMEKQSAQELQAIINHQLKRLPARMKEVFLLSRQECLSHKEISEMLNISGATVKKQIGYALKVLRGPLNEYLNAG